MLFGASARLYLTAWQFETGDACLPGSAVCWCARNLIILVDIPEGAVIYRIDIHRGVVTPARVRSCLYSRTIDNGSFAEGHLSERIARQTPGVAYTRED